MPQETQYWVSSGLTLLAVLVALLGPWIRYNVFRLRPKLHIAISDGRGELVPQQGGYFRRFYHILLTNKHRYSKVTNVKVFVLEIVEPDVSGKLYETWSGCVPLRWQNETGDPIPRVVGPEQIVDFCCVSEDSEIRSEHPIEFIISCPFYGKVTLKPDEMIVTLQARGDEVDSNILRVKIKSDGEWSDDAEEMKKHFEVCEM